MWCLFKLSAVKCSFFTSKFVTPICHGKRRVGKSEEKGVYIICFLKKLVLTNTKIPPGTNLLQKQQICADKKASEFFSRPKRDTTPRVLLQLETKKIVFRFYEAFAIGRDTRNISQKKRFPIDHMRPSQFPPLETH